MLFVHTEVYGGHDYIEEHGCGASGLYQADGRSPPRPVTVGEAWCAGAKGEMKAALSADARSVFLAPESGYDDCNAIPAFDFAGARWREAARVCGSHLSDPAISPGGKRIAVALGCGTSYGGGEPPRVTPRRCVDREGDRITVMNVDGSAPRIVGEPGDETPRGHPTAVRSR
ncbi:MAG TPA: hypothetical protein VFJ16_19650 [Longimicrobium sp.]|nr:hypothetical protein [Longimicrobium sp.]